MNEMAETKSNVIKVYKFHKYFISIFIEILLRFI